MLPSTAAAMGDGTELLLLLSLGLLSAIRIATPDDTLPTVRPTTIPNDLFDSSEVSTPLIENPVSNVTVELHANTSTTNIHIFGAVTWTLYPETSPPDKGYRLTVVTTSREPYCRHHFTTYDAFIKKNETSRWIPHLPSSLEYRILQFGCSYKVMLLSRSPCDTDCVKEVNFTIQGCIDGVCFCVGCPIDACHCSSPILPVPKNFSHRLIEDDDHRTRSVELSWIYAENKSHVRTFDIFVYQQRPKQYRESSSDTVDLPHHQLLYESQITEYNYMFAVEDNFTYCIELIANDSTTCSRTATLSFSTLRGAHEDTPLESTSVLVLAILLASAFTVFLLVGGCLRWHNRFDRRRGILLHSIPKRRVQYNSSASSKSSCLTHTTYLSTEREDMNVLYVEQEIQEAREKGIVDFFEISYGRLTIGDEIGKGAFGRVCIAVAEAIASTPGKITVAVKYLRENANDQEKEDFLAEIVMMKKAGRHPNVVAMIGCCTLQQPYCMVMEYVSCGDLLNYLRKLRMQYEKSTGKMIGLLTCGTNDFGGLVGDAKDASSDQTAWSSRNRSTEKLIHEDCSLESNPAFSRTLPENLERGIQTSSDEETRSVNVEQDPSNSSKVTEDSSVLVSGDSLRSETMKGPPLIHICIDPLELQCFALQIASGMNHLACRGIVHRDLAARNILISESKQLKVADFGLSRSGVYVTQRGGRVPLRWLSIEAIRDNLYSTQSDVWAFGILLWEICTLGGFPYAGISDKDLFRYLLHNHRLEQPVHCSQELHAIMLKCWDADPKMRPNFGELCKVLDQLGQKSHTYVNFDGADVTDLPPVQQYKNDLSEGLSSEE